MITAKARLNHGVIVYLIDDLVLGCLFRLSVDHVLRVVCDCQQREDESARYSGMLRVMKGSTLLFHPR